MGPLQEGWTQGLMGHSGWSVREARGPDVLSKMTLCNLLNKSRVMYKGQRAEGP